MKFRPCIDLHKGEVKQIVGSSLKDDAEQELITNFRSTQKAAWYADKYKKDRLFGGHVIQLGAGCGEAAREALREWPGGLQIGGGITEENAAEWLNAGASALIVTSYVFRAGEVDFDRLASLSAKIGCNRLVLDLSCRKKDGNYWIVTDRWQKFTQVKVTRQTLDTLSKYCCEFLIHAVDVEGKSDGVEGNLIQLLGGWSQLPVTYAGGIHSWDDIEMISVLGKNNIDFTVGSALDIFGGKELRYDDLAHHSQSEFKNMGFAALNK